jgi:hypothetical protein
MSKFGLYSDKSAIPFENHLEGLEEEPKTSLLDLRNFVKSLGNNVIEEVRPHRIAYAKSLTFRTFLDIQPHIKFSWNENKLLRSLLAQNCHLKILYD